MSIDRKFQQLKEWREQVREQGPSADLCHEGYELADGLAADMSALLIIAKENVDAEIWEGLTSGDTQKYFEALHEAMGLEDVDQ